MYKAGRQSSMHLVILQMILSFYKSTSLANEDAQALAKFMVFMGEFY
jgi:hypothetical protein